MTLKELEDNVGTLSAPSKMPCYGYSVPAQACNIGSKLRKVANSVCSSCYALKGRYVFPNVKASLNKRLNALSRNVLQWELNITELIKRKEKSGYFRWHDSGDLQSMEHLTAINNIAKSLPHIKFWLPTRESSLVRSWVAKNTLCSNLCVRLSANIIGTNTVAKLVPLNGSKHTITTSSVAWDESPHHCPAYKQNNSCGKCRACWNPEVSNVNYKLH